MLIKHVLLGLSLSVILGMGWVFGKTALDHFPPILVAAFRFGIAAMALRLFFSWPAIPIVYLLLASTMAISVPYSLTYVGLQDLDVSTTVLLVQLEAPILIVLSAVFLSEVPRKITIVGVSIAVIGVSFVAGKPAIDGQYYAVGIVVASIFAWAIGQMLNRKVGVSGGIELLGALSLLATPQLVLLSFLIEDGHWAQISTASWIGWLQLIYLGVVMTAVGLGIWYYLISKYELHLVAPFLLLVPVVSVIGGITLLDETLDPMTAFGGALIVLGVAITSFRRRNRQDAPATQSERKLT